MDLLKWAGVMLRMALNTSKFNLNILNLSVSLHAQTRHYPTQRPTWTQRQFSTRNRARRKQESGPVPASAQPNRGDSSRPQRSYLSKALPKPLHEPKPHRHTAQGLPTPMPPTRSDGGAPAEVSDSDADNAEQEESEYEEVEEVEEQEEDENGDDDVEEYEEYEEEEVEEYEEVEEVEVEEKDEVDLSDSPIKAEEDRNG